MSAILILGAAFLLSVLEAVTNNRVAAETKETSTMAPLNNFVPLTYYTDNKDTSNGQLPIQVQMDPNSDNSMHADCPNTAILLNILNILSKLLPQDDKTILEPEKFKYVLATVKHFLETIPLSPENLELYNKFKNLEEHLDRNINGHITEPSLRERDDERLRTKLSLQYEVPSTHNQNCHEIFNNLINFINSAYLQILRYCAITGKCYENIYTNVYNGIEPIVRSNLTSNVVPIQKLVNEYSPIHINKLKTPILGNADLFNFVKNQESKGVNNIMTILQNYRPNGSNVAGSEPNLNDIQKSQLYMNPANINANNEIPRTFPYNNRPFTEPINEQNPNLQSNNLFHKTPNGNPMSWQSIISTLKESSGNSYKNQQHVKMLAQKLYQENNVHALGSFDPSVAQSSQILVNGHIAPIKAMIPSTNPKEIIKTNLLKPPNDINKNSNVLTDLLNLVPSYQQQHLLSTNLNLPTAKQISQTDTANTINKYPNLLNSVNNVPNMQQLYLNPFFNQNQQNFAQMFQSNLPQNSLNYKFVGPRQSVSNFITYDPNKMQYQIAYQPNLYGSSYQLINPSSNVLGLNQIPPKATLSDNNSKYNQHNPDATFAGNKKTNYDNSMLDLNRLLGVTNLPKLNLIPTKNGVVELTYMLQKPKPVYESQYYVKYRLPYQTFLYNLQNLLIKKPNLRNEPTQLYQQLLVGSNVTDTSKDLKGLHYEDIIKLTSTNGTLINAKIMESNDTIGETLKIVQKLNSKLPLENLINLNNINVTRSGLIESNITNDTGNLTAVNTSPKNVIPSLQRRGIYSNLNNPLYLMNQYNSGLGYNPLDAYQARPNYGMPNLKYGYNNWVNTNAMKFPTLYTQNLAKYPRIAGYGR